MSMNNQALIAKADSPKMFNAIARRYDILNYILSFGMDIGWRRKLAGFVPAGINLRVLDIATGTGDVAIALAKANPTVQEVVGADLSEEMLALGRIKVEHRGLAGKIRLGKADALALPFKEASFDVVTVAFGLRNMPDLMKALGEAYRVLKPGGRFIVLEFSKPSGIAAPFHALYLHGLVPVIGFLLTGNYQAYRYLSRTVGEFPFGERFQRIIRQVGFANVQRHDLSLGAAMIYIAEKKS